MHQITQLTQRVTKAVLPKATVVGLRQLYCALRSRRARRVFVQAPESPEWLGWTELERMHNRFRDRSGLLYDPVSTKNRGTQRAKEFLGLLPRDHETVQSFLEIGCTDGMACRALQCAGKTTTGIDMYFSEEFDKRASDAGVKLLQMDAARLEFEDGCFDVVFSYNTFEHLNDPEAVLSEVIRVLKPRGFFYTKFEPIYGAAWGLHAERSVSIPYCQYLFPEHMLRDFVNKNRLPAIDIEINKWKIGDYRRLWQKQMHRLKKIHYYEKHDISALNMIIQYPSCFKSKTKNFEDLLISQIELLFQKIY